MSTTAESPTLARRGKPRRLRAWLLGWLLAVVVVYGIAWAVGQRVGAMLMVDQPSIRNLQDQTFALASKVKASDGSEIYSFAVEKRDWIDYEDVSPWIVKGLVAVEDEGFFEHRGLNYRGIARAAVKNLTASLEAGELVFREGGSSITQQLAKQLYLSPERKLERKLKEALLAIQVEKNFKKEEILELYLNQVFLGHQRHGVEAASQFYFGKSARDLTVPEAALIAGLPQRPSASSPRTNPLAARKRRDHVLARMAECGYITRKEMESAQAQPIQLASTETAKRLQTQEAAPFFVEEIRRQLVDQYGDLVNTGGLEIETTLDMDIQRKATRAVRDGLRELDKDLEGFRAITTNLVLQGVDPDSYEDPSWQAGPDVDDVVPGVVLAVSRTHATVRVGEDVVTVGADAVAWTGRRDLESVLKRGDLAPFRLGRREPDGKLAHVTLEQDPELEGALVAIDVATGEVLAMVGGYDYHRSEFNKVSQARRQVGSAFKPIYYAVAMESGLLPSTTVMDEPTSFIDPWTGGVYSPENYVKTYYGRVTLREALEKSLNIASVRLLNQVGYRRTIAYAKKCGITAALKPYPSLALGAHEITLLEITAAYSVFPNGGLHVKPTLVRRVRDAKGDVMEQPHDEPEEVLSPQAAYQMCNLLRGVVQSGTATLAKSLGRPLAGKTGTTDDYSDAWFVGFTPSLVVGVWVGYEEEVKTIGKGYAGAKAALPIWIDFMRQALEGRPPEEFVNPGGIDFVSIDKKTGMRASPECPQENVVLEAFREDDKPSVHCTAAHHAQLLLPACLQRFPLDENGVLLADEHVLLQIEEERTNCPIVVDTLQAVVEVPWTSLGGMPRMLAYRSSEEAGSGPWDANSIEGLMERDRRVVQRSDLAGLGDFDVLEGRTVIITRNTRGDP